MPDLTFGEQVKIILGRKGLTIKELAEMIEQRTGKKMSRQNLTQRLGRDNFQEQDMRMIASILECPFKLSILGEDTPDEEDCDTVEKEIDVIDTEEEHIEAAVEEQKGFDEKEEIEGITMDDEPEESGSGRDITVGEFLEIRKSSGESAQEQLMQELLAEMDSIEREGRERNVELENRRRQQERQETEKKNEKKGGWMSHLPFRRRGEQSEKKEISGREELLSDADTEKEPDIEEYNAENGGQEEAVPETKNTFSDRIKEYTGEDNGWQESYEDEEEDLEAGDVNPYTGREYASNSVRMHPKRIGYVQVYNRKDHKWTDMTEWAFLGYQERKKMLLGKDYEPPIYLD